MEGVRLDEAPRASCPAKTRRLHRRWPNAGERQRGMINFRSPPPARRHGVRFPVRFVSTEAISTASLMDVPVYRRAGFVPSVPTRDRLPLAVCSLVRRLPSQRPLPLASLNEA